MNLIVILIFLVALLTLVYTWNRTVLAQDGQRLPACLARIEELRSKIDDDEVFPAVFLVSSGSTRTFRSRLVIVYISNQNLVAEVVLANGYPKQYEISLLFSKPLVGLAIQHTPISLLDGGYIIVDKITTPGTSPSDQPYLLLKDFVINNDITSESSLVRPRDNRQEVVIDVLARKGIEVRN